MKVRLLRLITTSGLATGVALLVMSCSLTARQSEHAQSIRPAHSAPKKHIVQLDFGRHASFAVCTEPACPTVTAKSLFVAQESVVPAKASHATNPSNSGDLTPVTATEPTAQQRHVSVQFMSGSSVLTAAGKAALRQALTFAHKADRIVISGRTDNIGASRPNQSLALARALAVRDYLLEHEPALPARIEIDAQGHCCFIASNDTSQGRQQNRRVEVVFTVPGQVTP